MHQSPPEDDRLETARLLNEQDASASSYHSATADPTQAQQPRAWLENAPQILIVPIALLTALGMAATAASTVFAYAKLLCKDPTHCKDSERNAYAGSVAIASMIANGCALLALGPLERSFRKARILGLLLWIVLRSMSVVALALGGKFFEIESTSLSDM